MHFTELMMPTQYAKYTLCKIFSVWFSTGKGWHWSEYRLV